MITQLTGFTDTVYDAQKTFRALLDALARPGILQATVSLSAPNGLEVSCAAACLTLFDLETVVWLQSGFAEDVRQWLVFHTGCRFTDNPQAADFALIKEIATAPKLAEFAWGNAEYPEASTSLLIQLPELTGGSPMRLKGPGILDEIAVSLPLNSNFWQQWQTMIADYPLGLDCWCFVDDQVLGLPRTAQPILKSQGVT